MSITKINNEPVELVTRFADLKDLDIVYVSPCPAPDCARGFHRGMLLRGTVEREAKVLKGGGTVSIVSGWEFCPPVHGADVTILTDVDVGQRAVYRVVEPRKALATAKKRKAEA